MAEKTGQDAFPGNKRDINSKGVLPRSRDSLETYLHDIKGAKSLSMEEEAVLAMRIRQGDKLALNELVQANLKFVVSVCRNYRFQGLSMGDLINEGNLGLLRAAQRFDGAAQVKFISYAVWWIRQGILNALAEQSRILKVPAAKVSAIARIGKSNVRLEQKLGRAPSMEEVAADLGMSEVEISECLQLASAPMSLDKPALEDGDGSLEEVLEDANADRPDKEIARALAGKSLADLLGTLEEREAEVLRLYYGIGRDARESMEEIAARYGVTVERVRQIRIRALERLRHPARMDKLDRLRD